MASERLLRLRHLFLPVNAPRVHGFSMAAFLVLSLIDNLVVGNQLVRSGGQVWTSVSSLPWLLGYLVSAMGGGLAGLDLALLRRRGLQRQVMLTLALMLLILAPAVVLVNPVLSDAMHRFDSLNALGIASFVSAVVMLLPVVLPNRMAALNGGQRRPDAAALHRSDDTFGEQLSDWLGYVISGVLGAALMLITGIALNCPEAAFSQVFEAYPMLPHYLGMTFVNGSLCVALAAFAATLRDRRIISEPSEKLLMLLPVVAFLIGLVVVPLVHPAMDWILPANRALITASLQRL